MFFRRDIKALPSTVSWQLGPDFVNIEDAVLYTEAPCSFQYWGKSVSFMGDTKPLTPRWSTGERTANSALTHVLLGLSPSTLVNTQPYDL